MAATTRKASAPRAQPPPEPVLPEEKPRFWPVFELPPEDEDDEDGRPSPLLPACWPPAGDVWPPPCLDCPACWGIIASFDLSESQ